jgi:hypothetical protein
MMNNDLDELMSRDPLDLSSTDIDQIIDYHRRQRARRASGEKPQKPAGPSVDISHITKKLIKDVKPAVQINRRKI